MYRSADKVEGLYPYENSFTVVQRIEIKSEPVDMFVWFIYLVFLALALFIAYNVAIAAWIDFLGG